VVLRFRWEYWWPLLSLFRLGLVGVSKWVDSLATNPWDFLTELTAEVDHRGMQWHLGGLGPECELVASATAFVAVVAVHRHVHGERTSMLWLGFVQWAVSIPLICSTTNTLEAQQLEDLLHGDLVAKPVEVDARHGWWLLETKRPFRSLSLYGERERSSAEGPYRVNWCDASQSVYG
jgi:hypothetical protein